MTYLTTAQAAARVNVKRVTILAWIQRHHLAGFKFGRDWALLPDDVDKCAEARPGPGRPKTK
jgi:excisionase family DNA binding protein